jgi:type IV secretory pathway TraG/TraD family ATPase VirD4
VSAVRVVKTGGGDEWILYAVLGGVAVFGALYGTLQFGHVLTGDGWLPGGSNPFSVGLQWFTDGHELGIRHAVLGALFAVLLGAVTFWWMDHAAGKRAQQSTIDYRARWLGRGTVMHAEVVQKDAIKAKLTDNPERFGLMVARTLPRNLSNLPTEKQEAKNPFIIPKGSVNLWCGYRDSGTAVMGTGSGKTTAVVVPLCCEAPGSVWVTSNRPDVVAALLGPRSAVGEVWTLDPQGVADMPATWYWNPLTYLAGDAYTTSEVKARQLAKQFAEAGRPLEARTDAFFDPEGQEALANLMLAAYVGKYSIMQVLTWAGNPADETPLDLLDKFGWTLPSNSLRSVYEMHEETRDSILGTARQMMRFMSNQGASAWVEKQGPDDDRPQFDPHAFVRSTTSTMICLSREGSGSFGPIVAALTVATAEAAELYAKTCPGGRLRRVLSFILDEAANVCRIRDLPNWYSHFGGRGIFVLTILQSLAQGQDAWGKTGMEKLWGATVVRLVGRGIGDVDFAESISKMCDDQDVKRRSRSSSRARNGGSHSSSDNWTRERILSVGQITSLPKWRVLVLPAGEKPVLAELVPYWKRSPEMLAAITASQEEFEATHVVDELVSI